MSSPESVAVTLNDRPQAIAAGPGGAEPTLAALLSDLGHAGKSGLAAAVNGEVVARADWARRTLRDGDRVLLIRAAQGG
jgi:sulfur carrier protein